MEAIEFAFHLNNLYIEKLTNCSSLHFRLFDHDFSQSSSSESDFQAGYVSMANSISLNDSKEKIALSTSKNLKRTVNGNSTVQQSRTKLSKKVANPPNLKQPCQNGVEQTVNSFSEAKPAKQLVVSCVLDGAKTFMCTLCSYRTTDNSNMNKHSRRKHGDHLPSYKCSTCDFSTPDKTKLKNHYMSD